MIELEIAMTPSGEDPLSSLTTPSRMVPVAVHPGSARAMTPLAVRMFTLPIPCKRNREPSRIPERGAVMAALGLPG
jgi:hypothetical protein